MYVALYIFLGNIVKANPSLCCFHVGVMFCYLLLHLVYIWTSYCHGIYLHFKFDLQIVVCFNLNLSIFVKQLLSEDHDRGLIL